MRSRGRYQPWSLSNFNIAPLARDCCVLCPGLARESVPDAAESKHYISLQLTQVLGLSMT